MDEDTSESIKREIHPPSQSELLKELRDPLAYMPTNKLCGIRQKRRTQAGAMIVFGIGVPIFVYYFDELFFPNGDNVTGSQLPKNNFGVLLLALLLIYLAVRGLYNLMALDERIAYEQRSGLLSMHPELRTAEKNLNSQRLHSPWPRRITLAIFALLITYIVFSCLAP